MFSDLAFAIAGAGGVGLLWTALVLGIRHGFDWDHIAAITDVTSTTATADAAEIVHSHHAFTRKVDLSSVIRNTAARVHESCGRCFVERQARP